MALTESRWQLQIFQAMDAAGKDGAIRHVMSGVNPQGCQVFSFKHPSATEQAYDACLGATSTKTAPWYVVPADDTENARLIIAQIIVDTFKTLKMRYPETDAKRRKELLAIRRELVAEGPGSD